MSKENKKSRWDYLGKELERGEKLKEKKPSAKAERVHKSGAEALKELSEAEKEIVAEARRRGIDPKGPLERWRRWKKRKEK